MSTTNGSSARRAGRPVSLPPVPPATDETRRPVAALVGVCLVACAVVLAFAHQSGSLSLSDVVAALLLSAGICLVAIALPDDGPGEDDGSRGGA